MTNQIAKYKIANDMSLEIRKSVKIKGKIIKVSYDDQEGSNQNWYKLGRALLIEGADQMNGQTISIISSAVNRVMPTIKQRKALIAIAKNHCPKVASNIRLDDSPIV
jgi:hypothetical protein